MHDESYINHYILEHDNWMLLSLAYCCAEGWKLPYEVKILVRDKSKYFDVDKMKSGWFIVFLMRLKNVIKQLVGGKRCLF